MSHLILEPTAAAEWQALVKEVKKQCHAKLDPELEHYLVLLLQHFIDKPEVLSRALALDYLTAEQALGNAQCYQLREVGDRCLLIAGLFPMQTEKAHVSATYYVDLGQRAYHSLSSLKSFLGSLTKLYASLGKEFVVLMDLLLCMRELASEVNSLTPLQAEELWRNKHSCHALVVLQRYTKATPFTA